MRVSHITIPWIAAMAAMGWVASSCDSSGAGIEGVACSTDGDCNPGLKCLPYQGFGDAGCASAGMQCLAPCTSDTDCKAQGPGLVCFTSCGSAACEAPGYLGVPLGTTSDAASDSATESAADSTGP